MLEVLRLNLLCWEEIIILPCNAMDFKSVKDDVLLCYALARPAHACRLRHCPEQRTLQSHDPSVHCGLLPVTNLMTFDDLLEVGGDDRIR